MNQRKHTPGRYALFSYLKGCETDKDATFCDQEAFADSQLERALDLRNCGLPIAGLGLRQRIKYYFFQNFRPFWVK
jgi:hypothetical protein